MEGQEIYLKDREMDFEGFTYKIQLICILIWTLLYALVASYKLSHFMTLAQYNKQFVQVNISWDQLMAF